MMKGLQLFEESQEKPRIIKSGNYTNTFCEKLYSLFEKEELTDVCIIGSDEVKFKAHKNILAVGSDFFAAMFSMSLKESKSNEVIIQEVNGETLKPILAFMYTGIIELQPKTVTEILSAANFFQIKPLIFECTQFIVDELDTSNCLGVAQFAEQHNLKELYEKAFEFACMHFDQVSNMEEFLNISEDEVILMISSEDLCVTSEETVFLSLVKWIEHDKEKREKSTFKLFAHLQYWLLSSDFIKEHRNKLPNEPKIVEMIFSWLEWHLSPVSSGLKYRKCSGDKLVIIQAGKMYTYNPGPNCWRSTTLPGFPSTFEKVVETNEKLIIKTENFLKCFDLKTKEMSDLPLETPRTSFGLAAVRNEIYVVGGRINSSWFGFVEKFNFSSGKWQDVADMTKALTNPAIAVAGRYLHVKGDEEFMGSLDTDSNIWTWTHFPFQGLSNFSLAGVHGKIFIVGQKKGYTCSCVYEHSNGKWKRQEMGLALNSPKCISWNNRLIACGPSYDGYENLNLVLEYDPQSNKWKGLAPLDDYTSAYDIVNVGTV